MEFGRNSTMNRSSYDCAPLGFDLGDVADLQKLVIELSESPIQSVAATPSMDAVLGAQFGSDLLQEVPSFGISWIRSDYPKPDPSVPKHWVHPEDGMDHVYSDLSQSSDLSDHSRDTTEGIRESEHKKYSFSDVSQKTITKRGLPLWEKRALEAQKFPADLLGDISGTTSSKVKAMSPEERELVLFKRKLRNRESARRSRERRRMLERLNKQSC
ncbi:hypothetical protein NDN08_007775 [Rhodosorus marinus]|uniref:BZIP domain-containing protein n=1 Tax=Rhodosorus marinus TaxID=101924 RepID=A0AAV8V1B5_9RHOD|nr:hypothetical protein NDN08_007775 [Rhodosorus marinus]